MRSVSTAVIVASMLLVACSDDAAPPSSPPDPSSSAPVSTPTSTSSTTTSSTTTSSTTAMITTTTTGSLDAEIEAALRSYFDAYWECGEHPATCDPATFTASEGTARTNLVKFYADMASGNGSIARNGSTLTVESVTTVSDHLVNAVACIYDPGIAYGPLDLDGKPTVLNDRIVSKRTSFDVYREDRRWLVGEQLTKQQFLDAGECASA